MALSLFVLAGAATITSRALVIPPHQSASADATDLPRMAVCVTGGLRSFTQHNVYKSYERAFSPQMVNATGLQGRSRPDMFLYATLGDTTQPKYFDPDTGEPLMYDPIIHSRHEADKLLRRKANDLNLLKYKLVEGEGELTIDDVKSLVPHREECFSNSFWGETDLWNGSSNPSSNLTRLVRSLNQFNHIHKGLKLVREAEKAAGQNYDVVILVRPDLQLMANTGFMDDAFLADVSGGKVLRQHDWFWALPRSQMERMLGHEGPMGVFLNCHPGEPCCQGQITMSEQMFEFVFSLPSWMGKNQEILAGAIIRDEGAEPLFQSPKEGRYNKN